MRADSPSSKYRSRLIPVVLLILAAGITLGVLSFKLADNEYDASVRQLESLRTNIEKDLVQRIEFNIAEAERLARKRIETAMLNDQASGHEQAIDPHGLVIAVNSGGQLRRQIKNPQAAPSQEDQRYFDLATKGGEDYEFTRQQPGRALDAYSFYLPRIANPMLKTKLQFKVARAAFKLGRIQLSQALYEQILLDDSGIKIGDMALSDHAGLALQGLKAAGAKGSTNLEKRLVNRLNTNWAAYPVAVSSFLQSRYAPQDLDLANKIRAYAEFEKELLVQWPNFREAGLLWTGESLWLAREGVNKGEFFVSRQATAQAELYDENYQLQLWQQADQERTHASLLKAPGDGRSIGQVAVINPQAAKQISAFDSRRQGQKTFIVVLLFLVAIAGIAMWVLLERQRCLAEFKVNLLANVSHELKTPISSIRILSELLASEQLPEDQISHFGHLITSQSQRLGQRVDDLLDYAKDGLNGINLANEAVDLGMLLSQLSQTFGFHAVNFGVRFTCFCREELWVRGDTSAIERIILNLLDNGLKYRQDENPELHLKVSEDKGRVNIVVEDNGIGISPQHQAKIFEEFFRVNYKDYAIQGAGLGLSISKSLADSMSAELSVESRLGEGSSFTLSLVAEERQAS